MNNRIALTLFLIIALALTIDLLLFDGQTPLFLAKQFVAFVEYLSFWR